METTISSLTFILERSTPDCSSFDMRSSLAQPNACGYG
jgi:hypothetical protein